MTVASRKYIGMGGSKIGKVEGKVEGEICRNWDQDFGGNLYVQFT